MPLTNSEQSKKERKPLSDTTIRNAKPSTKPYKLSDSHGLYIEIRPTGSKLWRYRYKLAGKEYLFALGEFTDKGDPNHLGLADARDERKKARELVKQGIHPLHDRKAQLNNRLTANENTFKAVAQDWIIDTQKRKGWTDYYLKQIKTVMDGDVYPAIGNLPVSFVTPDHIHGILDRIEQREAFTVAILCRQWCSAVFRYAIRKRKATIDPTEAFKGEIKRPDVQHSKPLSLDEIPTFLQKLGGYRGNPETGIAIRLLMLTLARTKELREATWSEFDLDAALWRVPAARMKKRREHIVPLSRQAVDLLAELKKLTGERHYLFPNTRRHDAPMPATTLNRALEYLGMRGKLSCHGFRSTASTQLNECGYRPDVIEMALAHAEKNATRKAYNQALYLSERREMLQEWADYLDGLQTGGKIVPFKRKAS